MKFRAPRARAWWLVTCWCRRIARSRFAEESPAASKWSVYQHYNTPDECRQVRSDITSGWLQDSPPDLWSDWDNFKSTS